MARKPKESKSNKVEWQGFINVTLNAQEKAHVKGMELDGSAAFEFLQTAADHGYKVSTTYTRSADFYTVVLYGNEPDCPNSGWAMSVRHSDIYTAFAALLFVVEQDGWDTFWGDRFGVASSTDW